jgi:hypothetical protein
MDLISFGISLAIMICATVLIANWGKHLGLKWGQIFLVGLALSPFASGLCVALYWLFKKNKISSS